MIFEISEGVLKKYNGTDECVIVPEGVITIKNYAFANGKMKRLILPLTLRTIEYDSFSSCGALEQIEIPEGVSELPRNAFSGCGSLKRVKLPEGLCKIGYRAFNYCYELAEINIPDSVVSIAEYAFENCKSLKEISIPASCEYVKPYRKRESGVWVGTYDEYPNKDDTYDFDVEDFDGSFPKGCKVTVR